MVDWSKAPKEKSFLIEFLEGWRFPVFMISLLVFSATFFISLAFVPPSDTLLGRFARDFQIWCLGYDPQTGSWEWGYFLVFLAGPLVLILPLLVIWKEPLSSMESKFQALPYVVSALFVVLLSGITLILSYTPSQAEKQKILKDGWKNLRVKLPPHPFTLYNQDGKQVSLEDFRGKKVVLLTGVYATCGFT